ncbi:MAG TPA: Co2+/Mg2+ efflux protein ApaG [Bacteroidia bacterium]
MNSIPVQEIKISVKTSFSDLQSNIELDEFFFVYNITIVNNSEKTVQLLSRRWIIVDSNGESRIVEGEGVVGQQPIIGAGQSYEYFSGCLLKTGFGKMKGAYLFATLPDFQEFEAEVPEFHMVLPWVLN